jgi:hypothetical protein
MCPQSQAEGCRAFAFAVAGVDDDDAPTFAFGFFIGLFGGWGFDVHRESLVMCVATV